MGKWQPATIISSEAAAAIRHLKTLPGKDMVLWGSISLAQALMREQLIDEYHIQLCPVITGGGRRLFNGYLSLNQLQLIEIRNYNTGTVFLNYKFPG